MPMELQAVTLRVAGSNPAGIVMGSVAQQVEQVLVRKDRRCFITLVVMIYFEWKGTIQDAANAGQNYSSKLRDDP